MSNQIEKRVYSEIVGYFKKLKNKESHSPATLMNDCQKYLIKIFEFKHLKVEFCAYRESYAPYRTDYIYSLSWIDGNNNLGITSYIMHHLSDQKAE